MPDSEPLPSLLVRVERGHAKLDRLLAATLDALLAGRLASACADWRQFCTCLDAHLALEEQHLLPRLDRLAAPRWRAHVYRAEHEKLRTLAVAVGERLAAASDAPPPSGRAGRRCILGLIDALHPIRHVLEHHQDREDKGLLAELASAHATQLRTSNAA